MTALRPELQRFFDGFNRAWLERRFDDVRPVLHPDVVIAPPGTDRVHGAAAFIESLRAFTDAADVHEFTVTGVDGERLDGSLVVAWLRYDIEYTFAGKRCREHGRETWILRRDGDAWRALLREVHSGE